VATGTIKIRFTSVIIVSLDVEASYDIPAKRIMAWRSCDNALALHERAEVAEE